MGEKIMADFDLGGTFGIPDQKDFTTLFGTIVGEAGAEPLQGKAGVAAVVRNRMDPSISPYFIDTYGPSMAGQLTYGGGSQFNAWKTNDLAYPTTASAKAWAEGVL